MDKATQIVTAVKSFPPLPAVAARLLTITANPDSSIDDIVAVINIDPSLAVETLRLANSPFFFRIAGVHSIKEALSVLGVTEIRNLVLSKVIFNSFRHINKSGKHIINKFWEHSFLCGLSARTLADDLKENSTDFFMAGLLHDIGKLIIYLVLPEDYLRIIKLSESHLFGTYQEESDILGVTHDELGRMLLTRWLFPDNLLSATGCHHHPGAADKFDLFPMVINAADTIAHCVDIIRGPEGSDLFDTLITRENENLFDHYNKRWNAMKLKQYVDKLIVLKQENADTLRLFLS